MESISRKALTDAVEARLATVSDCKVYVGEPVDVPLVDGSDGHVVPHAALYPSPGTPSDQHDMADTANDLDWLIQITLAAGWVNDLQALVTRVDTALYRWTPTITGLVCGPLRPPSGYDPGPIRFDRDVTPHRPWLPLQYRCLVTAT